MNPLWLALDLPPPATASSPPGPDRPASPHAVATLAALACWAGSLTPRIALAPPRALLLEIGGCLRLFGGIEKILAAALAGMTRQDFVARAAVAPTPQGALWLAQAATTERPAPICVDALMLSTALDALPLAPLDLPPAVKEKLAGFGMRRLGAVRRLPRAALARRIGAAALATLARAYGELPDPRPDFVFPEQFDLALDLPSAVDNAAALLFAARRLTAALAGWLALRQAGITACTLRLDHDKGLSTDCVLGFSSATRNAGRLERVLREHLERLQLPAAVIRLQLVAAAVAPLPGHSGALFDTNDAGDDDGMAGLLDRLRARLGETCVQGIASVADHRPECATRPTAAFHDKGIATPAPRPFWLLARPEPIAERAGRPWRKGALQLLAGPERIESGWWDGGDGIGDARRDYFVALTADARWAWVFRERRAPGGWFLHGWFG